MIIIAPKRALETALRAVRPTCLARTTIPILACVKIQAIDGKVTFATTTMGMWSSITLGDAEIEAEGSACIPLESLMAFVGRLGDVPIRIDAEGRVSSGRSRATIQSLDAGDFPQPNEHAGDKRIALSASEAERIFGSTLPFVLRDGVREYLSGVNIRSLDGKLTADASNAHIIVSINADIAYENEPILIPLAAIKAAMAAMGDDGLRLSLEPQTSEITSGSYRLTTRNIAGTFPGIDHIKPRAPITKIEVERDALIDAVHRVESVTEADKLGFRMASLNASGGQVIIESVAGGSRSATDEVEADIDGPDARIGANLRYVADLASILPAGPIEIWLGGTTDMISLTHAGMQGWTALAQARV